MLHRQLRSQQLFRCFKALARHDAGVIIIHAKYHDRSLPDSNNDFNDGINGNYDIEDNEPQLQHEYDVIRFTGGGNYFWWQTGAAHCLSDWQRGEIIKGSSEVVSSAAASFSSSSSSFSFDKQPLYGTSCGAVTASLFAAKVCMQDVAQLGIQLERKHKLWERPAGLAGVWGPIIEEMLWEMIPNDIPDDSLDRLHIVVTPAEPRGLWRGAQLLSGRELISCKADLIGAVMASIHIPFFLDKKPTRRYKGQQYIDGSLWQMLNKHKEHQVSTPALVPPLSSNNNYRNNNRKMGWRRIQEGVSTALDAQHASSHICHSNNSIRSRYRSSSSSGSRLVEVDINTNYKHPHILDVNFMEDDQFRALMIERHGSVRIGALKMINEAGMFEMMNYGYKHMHRKLLLRQQQQ